MAWAPDGLTEALVAALAPIMAEENEWTLEDTVKKMSQKIMKSSNKFLKDERSSQRGSATQAQGFVEDFVEDVMNGLSGACYEKPWFPKVDFLGPLAITAPQVFEKAKIFNRTLAPTLDRFLEEAIVKWSEEERVQKAFWDSVVSCGVQESHHKKANQHLIKSYDEAHFHAPYGTTQAETLELAMLQDFVKGWMREFIMKGWDVLQNGCGATTPDDMVRVVTVLFQTLTAPEVACVPSSILSAMGGALPASPWPFIAATAEELFNEVTTGAVAGPPAKRAKITLRLA